MKEFNERNTQALFDKELLTQEQNNEITNYRNLNIFSLNGELKLFLYLSVILFTSGIGILIYENIDTIGHSILIGLLLIATIVCYYFSFKKIPGFQKEKVSFESPVMDYIVLTANLLTCIFIAYLQFQYEAFGTNYGLAIIIPTAIGLLSGYYFDNKNVLSLAITGLAAYIGLTVTPQSLLQNDFYDTENLSYSAIGLGIVLLTWNYYANQINLKKHFSLVFLTFALHLISISCLNNLTESYWLLFTPVLALSSFYFYKSSYEQKSVALFVFTVLYAFIGCNVSLYNLFEAIDNNDFIGFILTFSPFYLIGSIFLFIQMIKKFNTEIKNDSI